jgi:hypothetical protein
VYKEIVESGPRKLGRMGSLVVGRRGATFQGSIEEAELLSA